MKKIIILYILIFLASCSTTKRPTLPIVEPEIVDIEQAKEISFLEKCNAKLEKGIFLYEINVPEHYYLAGDAIATSNHIIKFPEKKTELMESYRKNFYIYGKSSSQAYKLVYKFEKDSCYSKSVEEFSRKLYFIHGDYWKNYNSFYWIGNMAFLKFYAEFYVVDVGKIDEMIPKLEDYKCCYSNTKEQIDGKIIIKVKEFKILPPTDSDQGQ
ncbi:MAG: hypothetical protein V4548_10015 [Bacteroidota bacterium]